jgi:hypothetical protein
MISAFGLGRVAVRPENRTSRGPEVPSMISLNNILDDLGPEAAQVTECRHH